MRSAPPPARRGRASRPSVGARRSAHRDRDPVAVGEALSAALPSALLGRLLDLELLREVWRDAARSGLPDSPELADAAFPVAYAEGVLTLRARDRKTARALTRVREPLLRALLEACRLPGARLRLRVVFPEKRTGAASSGTADSRAVSG